MTDASLRRRGPAAGGARAGRRSAARRGGSLSRALETVGARAAAVLGWYLARSVGDDVEPYVGDRESSVVGEPDRASTPAVVRPVRDGHA